MGIDGNFDFTKYDTRSTDGSKKSDGRLTGDEVEAARADGWCVWDGCKDTDKIEKQNPSENKMDLYFKMVNSESYKEYEAKKNEILGKKLAALGLYQYIEGPVKMSFSLSEGTTRTTGLIFRRGEDEKNYLQAVKAAESEAKKALNEMKK